MSSKVQFHLPKVYRHRPASVLRAEEFVPVIKSRKYNLLKLKEIFNHREKDKRLGRVSTETSVASNPFLGNRDKWRETRQRYREREGSSGKKMTNNSYLNLMQKVRENYRYCSLEH